MDLHKDAEMKTASLPLLLLLLFTPAVQADWGKMLEDFKNAGKSMLGQENNTAGLSISASAYNNGVRVTVTNNTGSTVDLAETTLHLKSQPRS